MKDYKIVVLGSGGVGKSALTVRFVENRFSEQYDPTIEDSYQKQIDIDGKPCKVEIIDTAGTEQFMAMKDMYMKTGQGFLLVYSITSSASLQEVIELREQLVRVKESDKIPLVLVGNKCDLESERQVTKEDAAALASKWGSCAFMETSARQLVNVEAVFLNVARQVDTLIPGSDSKKKNKKKSQCLLM